MSPEGALLEKKQLVNSSLQPYGFIKTKQGYMYQQELLEHSFLAIINIDLQGQFKGQLIEQDTGELYLPLYAGQHGVFVEKVRRAYLSLVENIIAHCYTDQFFKTAQGNHIAQFIWQSYGCRPEFIFEEYKDYAVFRHQDSHKWFATIFEVDKTKLCKPVEQSGSQTTYADKVEILLVKVETSLIDEYLRREHFYYGYHMNRKHWLAVVLDQDVTLDELQALIEKSYVVTSKRKAISPSDTPQCFLIPANPKYYDIVTGFAQDNLHLWKQVKNARVGDLIYIYVGVPVRAILYECRILKTQLPWPHSQPQESNQQLMQIEILRRFDPQQYPISLLQEQGVKSVRSARGIPRALLKLLNQKI